MSKKILVIDDEELITRSLTNLLERNKFEVFVAKNGQDALIMVEEEKFDLIISDIRMPGMNGVEVVKNIFSNLEKTGQRRPPIVFITGYADEECEKKTKELNAIAYIYKPFDISELIERVEAILR